MPPRDIPTGTGEADMPRAATGGRRAQVTGSPWQGIVDAAQSAVKQFGDPVAMEGMNAATTAADAVEALGKAFSAVGQTTVENVAIDPKVASLMESLGQYVMNAAKPTRDAAAAIIKAHQPKIDRVVEGSPKERRWDIQAHDGKLGGGTGQRRRGLRRAG